MSKPIKIKRSEKRKDTASSEENDKEDNHASIQFQVEFPTKPNQTLYILGNIEELGNWNKDKAIKLIKLDEKSDLWETDIPLECPVGMTIKYKFLILDSNNVKNFEKLPNDTERSITTKKPGKYIIMNFKNSLTINISYIEKNKRSLKRKLSRINYDVLNRNIVNVGNDKEIKNLKFNFKKTENESEYISYLSDKDLISYENNIANFDTYDKIPDFDYTQKITSSDRCIIASIYLPFYLKKNKNNDYEIIEQENSLLLRYINTLKKEKKNKFNLGRNASKFF